MAGDSMAVANEILRQLGGQRFTMMTGANNFTGSADTLTFKLPKSPKRIRAVRITLTPDDLYTVTFYKWTRRNGLADFTIATELAGVSFDQLRAVFTSATGLETSLGTMENPGPTGKGSRSYYYLGIMQRDRQLWYLYLDLKGRLIFSGDHGPAGRLPGRNALLVRGIEVARRTGRERALFGKALESAQRGDRLVIVNEGGQVVEGIAGSH